MSFRLFFIFFLIVGQSRLREIFLKTENHIGGRYLAEMTREVSIVTHAYLIFSPLFAVDSGGTFMLLYYIMLYNMTLYCFISNYIDIDINISHR